MARGDGKWLLGLIATAVLAVLAFLASGQPTY
jgi:hypothetical protein